MAQPSSTDTARRWVAITKSDNTILSPVPDAVYVGGDGDVVAIGDDGVSGTFTALAGAILPIRATKVMSAGTTATGLVALYNQQK